MRKAYMKTIEVVLAGVFTVLFLMFLLPRVGENRLEDELQVVAHLRQDPSFRDFAAGATGCMDSSDPSVSMVGTYLPEKYDFDLCIDAISTRIPDKKIFIDSAVISGNMSSYQPKTIRLFYWLR